MIVPQNRLLVWTAAALVPLATLATALPEHLPISAGGIALFALVVAIDALLASSRLEGLTVAAGQVTRLSRRKSGEISLAVTNRGAKRRLLRMGLPLPPELRSECEEMPVVLPEGCELSRLAWPVTALERGKYMIETCYVEAGSPLGFWALRQGLPTRIEVRAYPNLVKEQQALSALFLRNGAFGVHAHRQVGKGRDFEKLRDYIPGDSFEDIHWKATAKRGRPVTKVFQIERTQEVYVLVDTSRLSARMTQEAPPRATPLSPGEGSHDEESDAGDCSTLLEQFMTAGLVLGLAAERQGDHFGVLPFGEKVLGFVRARSGKAHYHACRDALYELQPRQVTPDFEELFTFVRLNLRRRALLVILTSLDDPLLAESFLKSVELVSRQHLVVVAMMRPAHARPLFCAPDAATVDDVYQNLGGQLQWQALRELEKTLHAKGVQLSLVENQTLAAQIVSQYISIKQRQLL